MSVTPKVTAHSETAALWHFLEGDRERMEATLRDMSQPELREYRGQLRELARSVDDEIFRQYNIPATPTKTEGTS